MRPSPKDDLRAAMRRLRGSIPPGERARLAELVEETLFTVDAIHHAATVMLFYAFGTEVATAGMAERVVRSGKRLLLPYLQEAGMEAAEVRPGDPLHPTEYGPREPIRRIPVDPRTVDVVVAPGLAFDRDGHRLGYGGGHYDRYLGRLGDEATRIGVAFSLQVVDVVPTEPEDRPVDLVVTDQGVIDTRSEGGGEPRR
ncbi:MAG: 5-formyltetrahydrofolate cyclo-ligase [Actinomycetota bacterium]